MLLAKESKNTNMSYILALHRSNFGIGVKAGLVAPKSKLGWVLSMTTGILRDFRSFTAKIKISLFSFYGSS